MDYNKEIDDLALSVGMMMSDLLRRCRDDAIGYANKIPLAIRHGMANELAPVGMKFLAQVAAWERIEKHLPEESKEALFYELVNMAADTIENLNQYRLTLDINEAPLHIIRDKRIR